MDQPPPRSWLRIRLRTLLLLMLVSGSALGLVGREARQAQRRAQAAQDLSRAVSKIEIEYCTFWGRKTDAPPPAWQRRILGEHYFQRITAVAIVRPGELPNQGRQLGELRHLQTLELHNATPEFTDEHAAALRPLRNLKSVSLGGAAVTDAGLACLSPKNPLRSLDLFRTLVTDAGLKHLAQFESLELLDLSETLITDDGLKHLARLPRLKILRLSRVMVSDQGVRALAQCKQLETLALDKLPLSADDLAEIAQLRQLKMLEIGDAMLDRDGVCNLQNAEDREKAIRHLGPPDVFWAINRRHAPRNTPYLQWLLEHGADPNGQQYSGMSPTAVLAWRGALEPVAVLLRYGAELNPRNQRTPLSAAAQQGHLDVMRFLLAYGADPNFGDGQALTSAAYGRQEQAMRLLLTHGAQPDLHPPDHLTPLMICLGHANLVRLLLESGADPNLATSNGDTALHLAARGSSAEVIEMLLDYGADRTRKNKQGETPYDLALQPIGARRRATSPEVLELLRPQQP